MASDAKRRRVCTFQDTWKKDFSFLGSVPNDKYSAKCSLCMRTISVKEGIKSVRQHAETSQHKANVSATSSKKLMTNYVISRLDPDQDKIVAAEAALTYHNVRHHLSYNSLDCGVKVLRGCYSDSKLIEKTQLGRTKASSITNNVLKPHVLELIIDQLNDHGEVPFCVGTDASNHGSRKMYPVCARYYTRDGLREVVLDFYEDPFEDASSVKDRIVQVLEKHSLQLKNVIGYRADNASVNYGVNHSVFTLLQLENPSLVQANCFNHVLHNAARSALQLFSVDVENVVLKCFAEFSKSAKKEAKLKEEFQAAGQDYQKMVRHVVTRWLTLFEGLSRIVKNILPIKSYFVNCGEDMCDKAIWNLFSDQEHELSSSSEPTINEIKLYFAHSFLSDIHSTLLALESESTLACHLSKILCGLRVKIETKRNDKFFGMIPELANRRSYLPVNEWKFFECEALKVYDRFLLYLDKYFTKDKQDFYERLSVFDLSSRPPTLDDILKVLELDIFKRVGPVDDRLYDDIKLLQNVFLNLEGSSLEKWTSFFQSYDSKNCSLFRIVSVFMSIPISNAFVERVFSVMEKIWTDDRNRLFVNSVESELCVYFNFDIHCDEFYKYVLKRPKLLNALKSGCKYSFKQKA